MNIVAAAVGVLVVIVVSVVGVVVVVVVVAVVAVIVVAIGIVTFVVGVVIFVVECEISRLVSQTDMKTGKRKPKRPTHLKTKDLAIVELAVEQTISVELFKNYPQLGRFTLRDEGKTIAIGKVMKLIPVAQSSNKDDNKTDQ